VSELDWLSELAGRIDLNILQTTPYVVVAPREASGVASLVSACAENGWRVMPLGSGGSFPGNFAIRHQHTVAMMLRQLREAGLNDSGRLVLQCGVDSKALYGADVPCERRTVGGLLCGHGSRDTLHLAQDLRERVISFETVDAMGNVRIIPGPASPAFALASGSAAISHSRGRLGILLSITIDAATLPLPLPVRTLISMDELMAAPVISRTFAERAADARAVFDW
jgi:FAD/FMN-containing dehydrogenase